MSQRDTALITGASRGIGRATALELAKDNVDIVVNYHQSNEEAQTTIEEIEDYGVDATAVQADVADIDQVKKLVSEAMTFSDNID
jgi:3-oxoacyl-[acyl-carrier protein] reductase